MKIILKIAVYISLAFASHSSFAQKIPQLIVSNFGNATNFAHCTGLINFQKDVYQSLNDRTGMDGVDQIINGMINPMKKQLIDSGLITAQEFETQSELRRMGMNLMIQSKQTTTKEYEMLFMQCAIKINNVVNNLK
jgi:hypothetical protein